MTFKANTPLRTKLYLRAADLILRLARLGVKTRLLPPQVLTPALLASNGLSREAMRRWRWAHHRRLHSGKLPKRSTRG